MDTYPFLAEAPFQEECQSDLGSLQTLEAGYKAMLLNFLARMDMNSWLADFSR